MSEGLDHGEYRTQQRPEDPKETERLQKALEEKEARERALREKLAKAKEGKKP